MKIFGDNYNLLQQSAAQAEKLARNVKGVVDIDNGLVAAGSSLVIMPNVDRLSQFGITLKDFQEQLSAYVGGVPLCQNDNVLEPLPSQAAMTGGLQIGSVQDGESRCVGFCCVLQVTVRILPEDDASTHFLAGCNDTTIVLFLYRQGRAGRDSAAEGKSEECHRSLRASKTEIWEVR